MRYYVVSDVHSFYTELIQALTEKGFFEDKEPHKLIICGDMFDRGSESLALQKFIMELLEKDEIILVRGNHEELMLSLIENAEFNFGRGIDYTHHWSNGTVRTVTDLTGMDVFHDDYKDIINKLCATPYIKDIIPQTINYYETEHYIFVHGWIPCTKIKGFWKDTYLPIENWREVGSSKWYEARWINGMFAHSQGVKEDGKTIICGHFHASWGHIYLEHGDDEEINEEDITNDPYYADGIVAIDGCTVMSGKVNCLVLEDNELC